MDSICRPSFGRQCCAICQKYSSNVFLEYYAYNVFLEHHPSNRNRRTRGSKYSKIFVNFLNILLNNIEKYWKSFKQFNASFIGGCSTNFRAMPSVDWITVEDSVSRLSNRNVWEFEMRRGILRACCGRIPRQPTQSWSFKVFKSRTPNHLNSFKKARAFNTGLIDLASAVSPIQGSIYLNWLIYANFSSSISNFSYPVILIFPIFQV